MLLYTCDTKGIKKGGKNLKREKLKEERERMNLNRFELAEKLGVSEVTIRKIESGDRNPSIKLGAKISMELKKPIEYLFPDIFFNQKWYKM